MTIDSSEVGLDEDAIYAADFADPLASYRARFHLPTAPGRQRAAVYFCGNSLGLQPKSTQGLVEHELRRWAERAVEGHFDEPDPWYSYHQTVREPLARLVGAYPDEVVAMNSLTANLHLMLASFYRPTATRQHVLIGRPSFPSDLYAVKSQIAWRGLDPASALTEVGPDEDDEAERSAEPLVAAFEHALAKQGERIALVLLEGVNYFTGQHLPLERLTRAAHRVGALVGVDLAHAIGNVPLALDAWGVDFAVWCSYKYLNAGPGAVAGCFVHRRHTTNPSCPRLAGWWGNDPATRFRMHLQPEFVPAPSADGWQLSNPPILALAPLRASCAIFDEATLPALRAKSRRLTGLLQALITARLPARRCQILTPKDPEARGCQLSLRLPADVGRRCFEALSREGFVTDFRQPDVIRVAPVPLYNTYHEVFELVELLEQQLRDRH